MAKLPQGDITLPEMLPDGSLGLGRGVVNKWNLNSLRISASRGVIGTAFAPRQDARQARPKTDQSRNSNGKSAST
jgi:hypothetical protein